ncbi:2OG-Fe(II) oxygenase [Thalassotalea psychrophila]|uniref:2OG-Fe(II) oxygenase n=1 Tax=Thalassotalea psychrophila TaxID=3065647 RepID=A0ABY9TQK7_9GAMM|nr:2OG-Fe(II) oxygenase [Colwelliaceae bacterium SQ149]
MNDLQQLKNQATSGDSNAQLLLSKYYLTNNQHDKFNELFTPLLKQGFPPALLTKVDLLFQQSPNQAISFLLELAKFDVPNANYKLAMLLYFHPELTLDFSVFLKRSCRLNEIPGIIAACSLYYQLGHYKQAEALLTQYQHIPQVGELLDAMQITDNNSIVDVNFSDIKRPKPQQYNVNDIALEINLFYIDNFLTKLECEWLKIRSKSQLTPAYVVDGKSGEMILDNARSSQYSQLFPSLNDWVLLDIEQRISTLVNLPITHGEVSNVLYYQKSEEYKPHYDFFHPNDAGSNMAMKDGGQRIKTAICYLEESKEGGETSFPRLSKQIEGKKGRVVVFSNTDINSNPLPLSLHQGKPVKVGNKWILTKWYREKETSYKYNLIKLNL